MILESDINPQYISLNINSIPTGEISTKDFPVCVFYTFWESRCLKIIVARFTVSHPEAYLYCWICMDTQILSPHFLEQGLQKNCKKQSHQLQWWAFSSTIVHSRYMYIYAQKDSGCNTGLNSAQLIIISARKNLRHSVS